MVAGYTVKVLEEQDGYCQRCSSLLRGQQRRDKLFSLIRFTGINLVNKYQFSYNNDDLLYREGWIDLSFEGICTPSLDSVQIL